MDGKTTAAIWMARQAAARPAASVRHPRRRRAGVAAVLHTAAATDDAAAAGLMQANVLPQHLHRQQQGQHSTRAVAHARSTSVARLPSRRHVLALSSSSSTAITLLAIHPRGHPTDSLLTARDSGRLPLQHSPFSSSSLPVTRNHQPTVLRAAAHPSLPTASMRRQPLLLALAGLLCAASIAGGHGSSGGLLRRAPTACQQQRRRRRRAHLPVAARPQALRHSKPTLRSGRRSCCLATASQSLASTGPAAG